MDLIKKQNKFIVLLGKLILRADELGYVFTEGDGYRDRRCSYGHQNSLHRLRLAHDFNFFNRARQLIRDADPILELGSYWESLDPECVWGGRFGEEPKGAGNGWDGGHFSLAHGGMR